MGMKIIRHSRKILVYSLSLIFYLQPIFCTITQKDEEQLKSIVRVHGIVGDLIDTLQQEIGLADAPADFEITFPEGCDQEGREHTRTETLKYTKDGLIDFLDKMHQQRMYYDARTFYAKTQNEIKNYNKKLIRANFLTIISHARSYQVKELLACAVPTQDLSQNPKNVDAMTLILNLQAALGRIQDKSLRCGNQTVSDISENINKKHIFFENERACCSPYVINQEEIDHLIELRSRYTAYLTFAQLQMYKERLSQVPVAPPSTTQLADPFDPRGIGLQYYNPLGLLKNQGSGTGY